MREVSTQGAAGQGCLRALGARLPVENPPPSGDCRGPPRLYGAATDAVEWLQADAPPLGILRTIPIHIGEPVDLHPGDLYLVFSDGIFEAKDPDDALFGDDRVEAAVRAHRHGSPREILAAVREAVDALARGRPADDDRTAITIQRL